MNPYRSSAALKQAPLSLKKKKTQTHPDVRVNTGQNKYKLKDRAWENPVR